MPSKARRGALPDKARGAVARGAVAIAGAGEARAVSPGSNGARTWGLALIVAAAAALASAPALRNGLFWDDAIVMSRQLPAMGSIGRAFFLPPGLPQFIPEYYRPVVFLSLLLDRAMWGSRILGFHLTVLALHAAAGALVFVLVRRALGGDAAVADSDPEGRALRLDLAALAGGLLFAVHPVHAEATAWIMGRADVLAGLFVVASLIGVVAMSAQPRRVSAEDALAGGGAGARAIAAFFIVLFSALALLSKESAIVLPALAMIALWGIRSAGPGSSGIGSKASPTRRRPYAATLMLVSAGIGVALVLRLAGRSGTSAAGQGSGPAGTHAARVAGALVFGSSRLAWPWPVPSFHSSIPAPGIASIAGTVLLIVLMIAAGRSSRSGRAAALFTGVALLPALAPAVTGVSLSPVADRYLYLPSVGVCWMVGVVVGRCVDEARGAGSRSAASDIAASVGAGLQAPPATLDAAGGPLGRSMAVVALFALAAWLVAGAVTTLGAVALYKDDATFWSAAIEAAPSDPFLLMKHGQALGDAGRFPEAAAELKRALVLGENDMARSTRTVVLDNLGDIALRQQHWDEAEEWLKRAVSVGPGYAPAHLHAARLHRARALAAGGAGASGAGGGARGDNGAGAPGSGGGGPGAAPDDAHLRAAAEWRAAVSSVDKAISLEPASTEALLLRADLALDLGDGPTAIASIREALRYMPAGPDRTRIETALRSLGTTGSGPASDP